MTLRERAAGAPFSGRRVLLGVSGGIAAYKSIMVARDLTLSGAEVDVVLTAGALDFVRPLTFEALTGRAAHHEPYTPGDPLLHIRLAKEADIVVLAPATANLIARSAAGMADDLLTSVLLATEAPVMVCPAMNDRMYAHRQTQANLARLSELGFHIVGPAEGPLAWGEGEGRGRMVEPPVIVDEAARLVNGRTALSERTIVVTAGPTREAIDPVRYIGNRSSGRMGFALAAAAWRAGADVTLITGPTSLETPTGARRVDVQSAEEMHAAVSDALATADVLVMAAAVADFKPTAAADQKYKKGTDSLPTIELTSTPDILRSTIDCRRPGAFVVGFALETEAPLENARKKLREKELDLLVLNDATEPGAGFEVETNRVTLLHRDGAIESLPLLSKREVAERIIDRVAARLSGIDG